MQHPVKVYLVQHARAMPKAEDPERGLSAEGRREVARIGAFVAASLTDPPPVIHHSGKARARQTAEALATALGSPTVQEADGLAPLDDPRVWAGRLGAGTGSVLLVGHLPHLAKLAALLLTGSAEGQPVRFSNAGVVCLVRADDGSWSLLWSVVPALVP